MMATASAAATPESPDISIPSQPSGLSSAKKPAAEAIVLRNEVTESPGRSAAWTAPFRIGDVRFIAVSRGALVAGGGCEYWGRAKVVGGSGSGGRSGRRGVIGRGGGGR